MQQVVVNHNVAPQLPMQRFLLLDVLKRQDAGGRPDQQWSGPPRPTSERCRCMHNMRTYDTFTDLLHILIYKKYPCINIYVL